MDPGQYSFFARNIAPYERCVVNGPLGEVKRDHTKASKLGGQFRDPSDQRRPMTLNSLLADARRPLTILAQSPGDFDLDGHVTVLSDDLAQPRSDMLWHLGRQQAKQGKYTDPATLLPRYARPPEAVQLWDSRKSGDLARQ